MEQKNRELTQTELESMKAQFLIKLNDNEQFAQQVSLMGNFGEFSKYFNEFPEFKMFCESQVALYAWAF